MPTYTYECRSCGKTQDVFHGMSAKPRVKCGDCGKGSKRLLGTGSGIIFKGSGFYETDYKTKRGKPETKSDSKKADSADKPKKETSKKSKSDTSAA